MNSTVETHPSLQKRRQPGRIRAFLLAVFVHGAFFALIVFGLTWQVSPTAPLMAELWDKLPPVKTAAPPEPPKPEPPPPEEKKVEPPKPEPPPKPLETKAPDVKPEQAKPDPEIAEKAEREKRRKEKLEREREEKKKAEEARKKQEEARKKREQEEAAKKKAEEERARREAEKARAEAATRRQTEVDRYVEQIKAKIRGKANVPDTVTGNPEVHVRLRILPGGEVLDATITKSSGNRAYDAAIERAIRSAQPLPVPPPDSELFPQFRDLILNIRHER